MKTDIWNSREWMENRYICSSDRRTGLRLRCEKKINPEVKDSFVKLVKWIRDRFFFPIRIPVYVKCSERIRARDGDLCVGIFFRPDNFITEPYISIATGDFEKLVSERGISQAKIAILLPLLHELTHYFQWINSVALTPVGEERQATRYAQSLMEEYLDDLGLPDSSDES
ncbi:MAG: hypothetical protein J5496_05910 [Lachnospiraceae bacterium]|nr:hypothetical protein [Lachnospiraceae bacterium]